DLVAGLDVRALGASIPDAMGVQIKVTKGVGTFAANGKKKVDGSVFGILAGAIAGKQVGIGVVTIHENGSDPNNATTGCPVVPLPGGNTCTDGTVLAYTGMTAGQ